MDGRIHLVSTNIEPEFGHLVTIYGLEKVSTKKTSFEEDLSYGKIGGIPVKELVNLSKDCCTKNNFLEAFDLKKKEFKDYMRSTRKLVEEDV